MKMKQLTVAMITLLLTASCSEKHDSKDSAFFYGKAYAVNGCINAFFGLKLYL